MSVKILVTSIALIEMLFSLYMMRINEKQRAQPLPEEVADIYDKARYQEFIAYKKDYQKPRIISLLFGMLGTLILMWTPFFKLIENISANNVYVLFLTTLLVTTIIEELISGSIHYYTTFTIEEKYHKNKMTLREFLKDHIVNFFLSLLMMTILMLPVIFILEHLKTWTHDFQMTLIEVSLILAVILIVLGIIYILLLLISYGALHLQYSFTELEEGPLRNDIVHLMDDSKKKVKLIKVYNESKKSTSKNAFLLRLLWHREFGIADNFLEENAHRELLAVLSHEVGHLKHKKTIYNYLTYFFGFLIIVFFGILLAHGRLIVSYNQTLMKDFHLTMTSYYLVITVITELIKPVFFVIGLYHNYVSRLEEYEADHNAVINGYGEELISTFKRLSTDELVDVNPAYLTEVISYDHPGMYRRIKAIRQGMANQTKS